MYDLAVGGPPSGELLTLTAHDRSYQMVDTGGKISKSMRNGHPYEAQLCEHVYQRGFKGLAVDVGANIGNHTLWFSMICGLKVAAIEPVQTVLLRYHVALNHADVEVFDLALGRQEDQASHQGKGILNTGKGPIRVVTLDSLNLQDVALIKIDVEGMEADVIAGGLETIGRDHPVIYAEFWDRFYRRKIERLLEPMGYTLTEVFQSGGATAVGGWE